MLTLDFIITAVIVIIIIEESHHLTLIYPSSFLPDSVLITLKYSAYSHCLQLVPFPCLCLGCFLSSFLRI